MFQAHFQLYINKQEQQCNKNRQHETNTFFNYNKIIPN